MNKNSKFRVVKIILEIYKKSAILKTCRYSSLVERQLPKLKRRVRFPLSACFYALYEFLRTVGNTW